MTIDEQQGDGGAGGQGHEPPPALVPPPLKMAIRGWIREYFAVSELSFTTALVPLGFLSIALFTRWIRTNFIFDEQEALLANPYVRSVSDPASNLHWGDAFTRDFWGLLPTRSIGSYRPLPDLVWRLLWWLGAREHSGPFLHHWVNVMVHGINGALMVLLAHRLTRSRTGAWLTGVSFTAAAVVTEAVSGVVGLADVLGALGALLALLALFLPLWLMPAAVFGATLVGLYSKESALCVVPLVPFAALLLSQITHPKQPMRVARMLGALVATVAAFALYVESRRRLFPAPLPAELGVSPYPDRSAPMQLALAARDYWHHPRETKPMFEAFLRWYAQPGLPRDPLNNPLAEAPTKMLRVGGALRVYFRGLVQVLFPWSLAGDYSSPQEPVPASPWFAESVLGALGMTLPWLLAPTLSLLAWRKWRRGLGAAKPGVWPAALATLVMLAGWIALLALLPVVARWPLWTTASFWPRFLLGSLLMALLLVGPPAAAWALVRKSAGSLSAKLPYDAALDVRPLIGVALVWIVVSYFPVSNIPIVLPTVRAERFWYFPVIGSSLLLGLAFDRVLALGKRFGRPRYAVALIVMFFSLQAFSARRHANDYTNDLAFWDATRKAVPNSAKAHLNYSVMQGARGNLEERRVANTRALELAPEWPMANIYLGDTLCRLHRSAEGWPHYKRGFELAPNDSALIALALQCLWDEHALTPEIEADLKTIGPQHPGSWLDFLQRDIIDNGAANSGVDPKYRPRGYNEGPKGD